MVCMNKYTTITIKTPKILRDQVQSVADQLGLPLTTIINAYLKDFIREKSFSVRVEPKLKKSVIKELEKISDQMDKRIDTMEFKNAEDLITYLNLRR